MQNSRIQRIDEIKLSVGQKEVIAGAIGATLQVFTGQPFDIVKVRMQSSINRISPIQVCKDIIRNEGPMAFYKGTMSPIAGAAFMISTQFLVNGTV